MGEVLRVNCTTGNSRPASSVTWKLNEQLVSIVFVVPPRVTFVLYLYAHARVYGYFICIYTYASSSHGYVILL